MSVAIESSIIGSEVVLLLVEIAFSFFTKYFSNWWPGFVALTDQHEELCGVYHDWPPGGAWGEIYANDVRKDIGKVLIWDRPKCLCLLWIVDPKWQPELSNPKCHDLKAKILVRFTTHGIGETEVQLEHVGLEKFGRADGGFRAKMISPHGWPLILKRYKGEGEKYANAFWNPPGTLFRDFAVPNLTEAVVLDAAALLKIQDESRKADLRKRLDEIVARCYHYDRSSARPKREWYISEVEKLEVSAKDCLDLLSPVGGSAVSTLDYIARGWGKRPLIGNTQEDPHSVEQIVRDFLSFCDRVKSRGLAGTTTRPGPKPNVGLEVALDLLIDLWVDFTNKEFVRNCTRVTDGDTGKNSGIDSEFKSPNMMFVHLIVRNIYPDMKECMIRTYIGNKINNNG